MRKIIEILLLCMAVLLSLGSAAEADPAEFGDISSHWAREAIERWSGLGIVNGFDGYFRPDDYVTRGEIAAILTRVMNYTLEAENSFADLDEQWYLGPMLKTAAAGIFRGSGGYIRPQSNITRQEAVLVFYRAFLPGRSLGSAEISLEDVSEWARPELLAMYAGGYIDDEFIGRGLKDNLTRAEAVALLDAILGRAADGEYRGQIQGNALLVHNELTGVQIDGDLLIPVGITGQINLAEVTVLGGIYNFSGAEVVFDQDSYGEVFQVDIYRDAEIFAADAPEFLDYYGQQIPVQPGVPVFSRSHDDFTSEAGRAAYSGPEGRAAIGIDVSAWQGEIDWAKVKADGVEFAMLRVGFRGYEAGTVNTDKYFHQNARAALENGIEIGVYFFSQAITPQEAIAEANHVIDLIREYNITYPVCFDWEMITEAKARTDGLPKETVTACAVAFCETVKAAGYIPAVYIYTETAYFCYDLTQICGYDLWFAKYAAVPLFYYDFQMWQFTDSGSVNGISGKVDMNLSFKGYR